MSVGTGCISPLKVFSLIQVATDGRAALHDGTRRTLVKFRQGLTIDVGMGRLVVIVSSPDVLICFRVAESPCTGRGQDSWMGACYAHEAEAAAQHRSQRRQWLCPPVEMVPDFKYTAYALRYVYTCAHMRVASRGASSWFKPQGRVVAALFQHARFDHLGAEEIWK